jgi:hypothetical protein
VAAKEKAAGVLATPATAETNTEHAYFTADRSEAKQIATIRAQFALRGFEVRDSHVGGWLVSRWGWARHCLDLAELRRLLEQIGGAA